MSEFEYEIDDTRAMQFTTVQQFVDEVRLYIVEEA